MKREARRLFSVKERHGFSGKIINIRYDVTLCHCYVLVVASEGGYGVYINATTGKVATE